MMPLYRLPVMDKNSHRALKTMVSQVGHPGLVLYCCMYVLLQYCCKKVLMPSHRRHQAKVKTEERSCYPLWCIA